jgi:hypothetical protein
MLTAGDTNDANNVNNRLCTNSVHGLKRRIMKIKYLYSFGDIRKVQVEQETEQSIWIDGGRRVKKRGFVKYFDSKEDAKDYAIKKIKTKIERHERSISNLKNQLDKLQP